MIARDRRLSSPTVYFGFVVECPVELLEPLFLCAVPLFLCVEDFFDEVEDDDECAVLCLVWLFFVVAAIAGTASKSAHTAATRVLRIRCIMADIVPSLSQ
jgi:hypothetical protein